MFFRYASQVLLFAVRPSFHCVASIALTDSSSGVWGPRQLFVATPTAISLALISHAHQTTDVHVSPPKTEVLGDMCIFFPPVHIFWSC